MTKRKQYGYVYLTTNTINGRMYIGRHKSELPIDPRYKGSGIYLKRAFEKYGKNNFTCEVLEYSYGNSKDLNELERYYGRLSNAFEDKTFYNCAPLGSGVSDEFILALKLRWTGGKHTEETKRKISEAHKGNPCLEETKLKISNTAKSKHRKFSHSEETKRKISEAHKGTSKPWVVEFNKSEDKKRKTAETHRGMKRSAESKARMSAAKQNFKPLNKGLKFYRNIETGEKGYFTPGQEPIGWVNGTGKRTNSNKD